MMTKETKIKKADAMKGQKRQAQPTMAENSYMTLRELKEQIDSTVGMPTPTACQLREDEEAVDIYKTEDYRITVYKNGFAAARSGKRQTVMRIDDCGGYIYDFDNPFLRHSEEDGTPHRFGADYFLDLPWPIRIMMEADDRLQENERKRERDKIRKHPEIPDDKVWMLGGYSSFEGKVVNRMLIEEAEKSMTDKQREVFTLYYKCGYTQQEIGEKLGLKRTSVQHHIEAALKKLRKVFEGSAD